MPATAGLVGRLRAAGIPAVVSGAGPSVLALTMAGAHPGPDAVLPIADGTGTAVAGPRRWTSTGTGATVRRR